MGMYEEIKAVAERNRKAKTKAEREEVERMMEELRERDSEAYVQALERLIADSAQNLKELTVSEKIGELSKVVSMSYIAKKYFGKSRSWIVHKLHGDLVNGVPAKFSPDELSVLKSAFEDVARQLTEVSAKL